MNIIDIPVNFGGGVQSPTMCVTHAMSQFIRLDKPEVIRRKLIEPGLYPASEWLKILGLSAHFGVQPNGDIEKYRATNKIAYHAADYNKNSVGTEFLVEGEHNWAEFKDKMLHKNWMTDAQYVAGAEIMADVVHYWDMKSSDCFYDHSRLSPNRKVDPGVYFDHDRYFSEIKRWAQEKHGYDFKIL